MTDARRRVLAAHDAPQVHIRRAYTDCKLGQLHVTTAYPSGGGFDEKTPIVCLHPENATGRWWQPLLADLGQDRSVYATDLPGHGQSDPVEGGTLAVADHVAAIGDLMQGMRLRSVDLIAHGLGAHVAAELAAQLPQQVRRLVLIAGAVPGGATRIARLDTPLLAINPADIPVALRLQSPGGQAATRDFAATTAELFGTRVVELTSAIRSFLDS